MPGTPSHSVHLPTAVHRTPAADEFSKDYRALRLLEHRPQLRRLRRTHLMPRDEHELWTLARLSGLARSAEELLVLWNGIKHRVRGLHERLFLPPAASRPSRRSRTAGPSSTVQAEARLAAIGFTDARGGARPHRRDDPGVRAARASSGTWSRDAAVVRRRRRSDYGRQPSGD